MIPLNTSLASPFKTRPALLGMVTFFTLVILVSLLAYQRILINDERIRQESFVFLEATREKLKESLDQGISATRTLSFFIQQDGSIQYLDSVAEQILAANKGIDALQLVPGGIIRYVYPLKGNEMVLGYDLLKDSTRNREAFKTIQKNKLFYAGPMILKQGGMAMVGRLPVFRNDRFWGFSAVVIKLSTLFKRAGIDSLGKHGYYLQVSKINPQTNQEEFFISPPKGIKFSQPVSLNMQNVDWKIAAAPVDPGKGYADIMWLTLLGLLFSIMGGLVVFTVAKKPQILDKLVTERTAALQESEKRYRSLIEHTSDGVIVFSFDGTIHQFNKSAYTRAGFSEEEFAAMNLKDLLVDRSMELDAEKMYELKAGKNSTFQNRFYKKDGSIMIIEISANLLPDGKCLALIRNITDRLQSEKSLKEREEKYRSLIEQASDGIVIINFSGIIVEVNNSICNMLGFSKEELLGQQVNDFIPEEDQVSQPLQFQALLEGKNLIYERRVVKKDGSFLSVEVNSKMSSDHSLIGFIRDISHKKKVEALVIQSERKYRSLIEQASDGIIMTDLAGVIREVNQSVCKMGGFSMNELVGEHVDNFMPVEDITALPLRLDELIKGQTLRYERRMLRKDGKSIDVEVNSKMANGDTLIGFVRDITDRKKAAEALTKSNERFELIARATNDAIWDHDFSTNETVGNDNLYNLYGFTRGKDRINFELFESRIHPVDRDRIVRYMQRAISEKSMWITEHFRFRMPDGNYRYFYDRAYIQYNQQGNPSRILGAMQDITQRYQDEQRLLKEKELSDSVINSLPGIFYLYDKAGKFIRWNRNFETVTEYNAEEIGQLHPLDFYDVEEKELVRKRIETNFIKKTAGIELNLLTKTGNKISFYIHSLALEYEGAPCIMGMGFDVTERKKIEQELLQTNSQLAHKASELKNSYSELERFAYIVSHDLQEPLRMVSSFLKLLEQKYKNQLDEAGEKYIHFAVDGADRMKQLITDLLEYSRTGTNKDIAADTDMNEVMEDVLSVLGNSIREQQALIQIAALPVLPETSKIQMFQLMQNLLSNALKYHSDKRPFIQISANESSHEWLFSIADNGIGIDPKFSEKIFVIFQRLHSRNEFSGTGIGLSICKKIVEMNRGKIWVDSKPGEGSTFYFSIPKK